MPPEMLITLEANIRAQIQEDRTARNVMMSY
jgi:hypothetical protein